SVRWKRIRTCPRSSSCSPTRARSTWASRSSTADHARGGGRAWRTRTAAPPRPRRRPRRRTSRRSARPRRPRRPPPPRSRRPSRERRLTAASPANPATAAIVDGFAAYRTGFDTITRRAQERFRQRDWPGAVADAVERLDLYGEVVDAVEHEV